MARLPEQEYMQALISELSFKAKQPEWEGRTIETVFFGGGTPSIFKASSYYSFFQKLRELFKIKEGAEISLEANPGSVDQNSLTELRAVGFNRISFGAQSFTEERLKKLGRIHSVRDISQAIEWARKSGFDNLSFDLMFGTPGQDFSEWQSDVRQALELSPKHLSAYSLTYEKGTQYFDQLKKGRLRATPDDDVTAMLEYLWNLLPNHGLKHYEVSNFAQPGFEAQHNLAYWNGQDYIGLGAGAHSMLNLSPLSRRRSANLALPQSYIDQIKKNGSAESWFEVIEGEKVAFEFFMLGLRKVAGVSLQDFKTRFGANALDALRNKITALQTRGLLNLDKEILRLTHEGLKLTDSVVTELA